MLYMVEMDLPDRTREDDWHAWYLNHIRKLLTVPGFYGSQRFESLTPTPSPFLAIHDVSGPELFESDAYKSVGGPSGTGEWRAVMTNWYRNLFDGIERMPEVATEEHLVIAEEGAQLPDQHTTRVTWLTVAGLDRSSGGRGFVILEPGEDHSGLGNIDGVRVFKPITGKIL